VWLPRSPGATQLPRFHFCCGHKFDQFERGCVAGTVASALPAMPAAIPAGAAGRYGRNYRAQQGHAAVMPTPARCERTLSSRRLTRFCAVSSLTLSAFANLRKLFAFKKAQRQRVLVALLQSREASSRCGAIFATGRGVSCVVMSSTAARSRSRRRLHFYVVPPESCVRKANRPMHADF